MPVYDKNMVKHLQRVPLHVSINSHYLHDAGYYNLECQRWYYTGGIQKQTTAGIWKRIFSLWKSIDTPWSKKVLLELYNLQLRRLFFHNIMNFIKTLVLHEQAVLLPKCFLTDWCHMRHRKYNRNIFDLLKYNSIDFFKLYWRLTGYERIIR